VAARPRQIELPIDDSREHAFSAGSARKEHGIVAGIPSRAASAAQLIEGRHQIAPGLANHLSRAIESACARARAVAV